MKKTLDIRRFFQACAPSKTLVFKDTEDFQYYIDFSTVRGGKIIEALEQTITHSLDHPTCQLFTGHIGSGKSTELLRLKAELEQQEFYVVYFESTQDLDMEDVDITDILLAIARQVSQSLEAIQIKLKLNNLASLFNAAKEFLQMPLDITTEAELSENIAKITAQTKDSPKIRNKLRQYLEPRTQTILEAINKELFEPATEELKRQGKKGLVVIIDNLDRMSFRLMPSGRSQKDYIFVDRGQELRQLKCHMIYTIPLDLIFKEFEKLTNGLGGGKTPKVLPMVPVQLRNGSDNQYALELLRQLVLARAFPDVDPEQRKQLVTLVFRQQETLDTLCRVSGGHIRNLLGLISRCLQQEDLPLSPNCLEIAIREYSNNLSLSLTDEERNLLQQVREQQTVGAESKYQDLVRSLFIFEYHDQQGSWFSINPLLMEEKRIKS